MKIGFIGLGIMGTPMAKNLLGAGHELVVYDRSAEKMEELVQAGAKGAASSKEAAEECRLVITMVPNSPHVKAAVMGKDGVLEGAKEGDILVDMSSIAPLASQEVYKACKEKGVRMIDAPVSGGEPKAIDGSLSIMVGGDRETFDEVYDILMVMGGSAVYCGDSGAGNMTKLANQIMIAGTLSGVCEALTYAKAKGLDLKVLLDSVSTGAAGSKQLDTFGPKILADDYAPGFFLKHFIKDMKLALAEANMSGLCLEVLSQALANYEILAAEGHGDLGTQALMKYYEETVCEDDETE